MCGKVLMSGILFSFLTPGKLKYFHYFYLPSSLILRWKKLYLISCLLFPSLSLLNFQFHFQFLHEILLNVFVSTVADCESRLDTDPQVKIEHFRWYISKICLFILQWKVRRTLAFSIHELAVILGDQLTAGDLVPVFNGFLKDLDEVRIGVLKHLHDFLKVCLFNSGQVQLCVMLHFFVCTCFLT